MYFLFSYIFKATRKTEKYNIYLKLLLADISFCTRASLTNFKTDDQFQTMEDPVTALASEPGPLMISFYLCLRAVEINK